VTRGEPRAATRQLSFVLLTGAALFVQSLRNVTAMRLGYDPHVVLVAGAHLRGTEFGDSD
jgi:hypothetical protein